MTEPVSLPRVPVPRGWIWPPLEGRAWLEEALATVAEPVERAPGEWMADASSGWRLYSSSPSSFDEAHARLLRQAAIHRELDGVLSSRRCLVVAASGDGFRVWQAVFMERSVWRAVAEAVADDDRDALIRCLRGALRLIEQVEGRWSRAAWQLPCTLETIGATDGAFVNVMPDVDRLTLQPTTDVRDRLLRQLRSLVTRSLGEETATAILGPRR